MDRDEIRFKILLILAGLPSQMAPDSVVLSRLKSAGLSITKDQLHIELAWLDEIAGAVIDSISGGGHVARLANDGLEHLEGSRTIPHIRKPRPGEYQGG